MRALVVIGVALLGTSGATARADEPLVDTEVSRLRLRASAAVSAEGGLPLRLIDVVDFSQADPRLTRLIGDRRVGPEEVSGAGAAKLVITRQAVAERLDALRVNMARVTLAGALRCEVEVLPSKRPAPDESGAESPPASDAGALLREPEINEQLTLAAAIRRYVEREIDNPNATVEVEFVAGGASVLELTSPPFEFRVSGRGRGTLGMREFAVEIRGDGHVRRTQVAAFVRVIKHVLIAAKPLNVGNHVRDGDIRVEKRMFQDDRQDLGYADVSEVIGQQVRKFVPVGGLVTRGDLKDTPLVKRQQPVTIVSGNGEVKLHTTGLALDQGGFGETVRVRIGQRRDNWRQLTGRVAGVGVVRVEHGL